MGTIATANQTRPAIRLTLPNLLVMAKKTKEREKTKLVPAALHAELSEYTSLLRALRTNDILDVASQLTRPYTGSSTRASTATAHDSNIEPQSTDNADVELSEDDVGNVEEKRRARARNVGEGEPEQPGVELEAELDGVEETMSKNQRSSRRSKGKKVERDEWTRWPLLEGDVHIPEWGFEDEVLFLARQSINFHRESVPQASHQQSATVNSMRGSAKGQVDAEVEDGVDDVDSDSDDDLPPHVAHTLTSLSSAHLTQVLTAIASHIPPSSKTLQSRFMPLNWQHVLNIVSVEGIVDPQCVGSHHLHHRSVAHACVDCVE